MLTTMHLTTVKQFVKVISITATIFFGITTSYCIRLSPSNNPGYLVHATGRRRHECRWNFEYDLPNRTNLMMIFRVLKSGAVGLRKPHYNFYTPDDPGKKWWKKGSFCRMYVKTGSNLTNCKPGEHRMNLCKTAIQKSREWPPTIRTDFALYSAVMSYQFVDCEAILQENRTWNLKNTVVELFNTSQYENMTVKGLHNLTVQTATMTETYPAVGISNFTDTVSAPPSVPLWVAVVVCTLLLFACTVTTYLFIKIRKFKKVIRTSSTSNIQ